MIESKGERCRVYLRVTHWLLFRQWCCLRKSVSISGVHLWYMLFSVCAASDL